MKRGRKPAASPEIARRILAAAENQFAAEGLAGARTDEIAAAARANKAMLYYYFGSKRNLHRAVLENLFRPLRKIFDALARSEESPRRRLETFIDGYFDFLAAHSNYPRLIQREAMESSREFEWIFREFFQPFQKAMQRLIEDGIEAGDFRRVDARHAVFSMIGMMNFYFVAARRFGNLFGNDAFSAHAVAARKRAVLDMMAHGFYSNGSRPR
jgi:AcrR family transcriptional regulator